MTLSTVSKNNKDYLVQCLSCINKCHQGAVPYCCSYKNFSSFYFCISINHFFLYLFTLVIIFFLFNKIYPHFPIIFIYHLFLLIPPCVILLLHLLHLSTSFYICTYVYHHHSPRHFLHSS